jgi:hypothetical protein
MKSQNGWMRTTAMELRECLPIVMSKLSEFKSYTCLLGDSLLGARGWGVAVPK